jgi:membrane protease subunit HflC
MKSRLLVILIALAVLIAVAVRSLYIVNANELAVVSRFGKIERTDDVAGLHLRLPFETVQHLDRRLVLQTVPGENVLTSDKKNLILDLLVRWSIKDPVKFVLSSGGSEEHAGQLIGDALGASLKGALGSQTLAQVVGADPGTLSQAALAQSGATLSELGVVVKDVSLQGVELPDDLRVAVFQRMQGQFEAQAKQIRADSVEAQAKARADTEAQRNEIMAAAARDAQRIRGEGEAQAALIYAKGFGHNVEFGDFYRSLEAYRKVLGRDGDILVIQPDGDFFKYLHSSGKH